MWGSSSTSVVVSIHRSTRLVRRTCDVGPLVGSEFSDELASYQGAPQGRRDEERSNTRVFPRPSGGAATAVMDPDATDEMVDHLVDFFEQVAAEYDGWAGGLHGRVAARLVEIAAPKRNQQALDVGTGTGLVAHLVAAKAKPGMVIGIDLSERMLSIARSQKAPNTQFVGMAAERLVFRPATFDLVTMGEALAYLADPVAALEEAHRALKPKGRLAVSSLRRSLPTPAQNLFFQRLLPLARRHYLSLPRFSSERSRFGEPDVLPQLLA